MSVSRREVLRGAGAAVASLGLRACAGGSSAGIPPATSTLYDLIVVGAGVAGISAARTALAYGANVLVLEAQNRIGGRTFTDATTFPEIGFDQGAQFFQAVLSGNELYTMAQAQGLPLLAAAGSGPPSSLGTTFLTGSSLASASDQAAFLATAAAIKAAVFAGGAAIDAGAPDVPISAIVASLAGLPWYVPAAAQAILEISGGTDRSLYDLYRYTLLQPVPFATPGDDFVVKTGLGTFVASLAKGLNVRTGAPVSAIATGGTGVTVTANGVAYNAKTVIVTASTNVLAKSNAPGGIAFSPALPASYVTGFAALPLTACYKALLGFNPGFSFAVPGVTPPNAFSVALALTNVENATYFPNFWGTNTCEFIATGDLAVQLEQSGSQAAAQTLLTELDTAFPGAKAAWDGRISGSSWMTNPYFGGAFSAAMPGQWSVRRALAQPIGNRLWFAGEAIYDGGARGLIIAAWRSGAAAASAALKTVGLASARR